MKKYYYLYVLQSLKDKNFYVGYTTNIPRRITQHNSGKVFSTKKEFHLNSCIGKAVPIKKTLQTVKNILKQPGEKDILRIESKIISRAKRFILFHNKRHPVEMGEKEIKEYLTNLAVKCKVAASTQNQALCAIIFLYKEVLKKKIENLEDTVWAKKPKKLPVVYTRDEVKAVLKNLKGTEWIICNLLYGAGLRLIECLRLRTQDIDFTYNQIIVRSGKGDKDRVTMLPGIIKDVLKAILNDVKKQHLKDLEKGYGNVYLPYAL